MRNIKLSTEGFNHTESVASNDPSPNFTEFNYAAVTLKQKLAVVSDFEGYSKKRNDIYKSELTELERDVQILELSKGFIDKHKAASLGYTPSKSPALDYKKQFDNLSSLSDTHKIKSLMDSTLASEIELKTKKKGEPKKYSAQDLYDFTRGNADVIPENWMNESVIPENWMNKSVIPENWMNESVIPENWMNESVIPENWMNESVIPENWMNESVIPENWMNESVIPENWMNERKSSVEPIDAPITPHLKM
jgi:hypothetical protein